MYDWSAEGYDAGIVIGIGILLVDTVGTSVGGVLRPLVLGQGVDGR